MPVSVFRVWPIGQEVTPAQPGFGPQYGIQLVEISGAGFVVSPDGVPRVRVSFGASVAQDPRVVSISKIRVHTPTTPIPTTYGPDDALVSDGTGLVNVLVEVLDAAGDPIIGESATLVDGYEYRREPLDDEHPDVVTYYTLSLIQQLRRDFIPNVLSTDKDIEYVVPDASLPSMTLVGPVLSDTEFFVRGFEVIDGQDQAIGPVPSRLLLDEPLVQDLVYGVEVYVGSKQGGTTANQNLMTKLVRLIKQRPMLDVPCDLFDPLQGVAVSNQMIWDPGAPLAIPREAANDDGLRWTTGAIRIRGVEIRGGVFAGLGIRDVASQIRRFDLQTC